MSYVPLLFFFFNNLLHFIYFIFGCVGSSLLCVGFSVVVSGGYSTLRCGAQAAHCSGFSCCRVQALGTRASVVVAHGLQ